jgi:hypothetical protein
MTAEIQQFWNFHQNQPLVGRNLIVRAVCPQLFGLAVVKLALLLVIIGGVPSYVSLFSFFLCFFFPGELLLAVDANLFCSPWVSVRLKI